jgi:hypothetical protein
MQEHELRVGDELVLEGGICLTLLAVEGPEAVFGITCLHPEDAADPAALPGLPTDLWEELSKHTSRCQ